MPREGTETELKLIHHPHHLNLEIRCPERGRKRYLSTAVNSLVVFVFGNKMPREGTETISPHLASEISVPFGNKMPREGTETLLQLFAYIQQDNNLEIRCPERGRKHIPLSCTIEITTHNLEIRCPERGRKRLNKSVMLL